MKNKSIYVSFQTMLNYDLLFVFLSLYQALILCDGFV